MSALFRSGLVVDGILILTLLEAAGVLMFRARTGRGPAPGAFVANIAAGVGLLLALRGALVGADWTLLALCLLAALVAHIAAVLLMSSRSSGR